MAIERHLPDGTATSPASVQHKAALVVCGHATDVDDAVQLLDMLGLREVGSDVLTPPTLAQLRQADHQRNGG